MTVIVLFTLTGYQVTSETAATRLLGRLGAALIELDRWLPAHREDIELLARDRPEASVRVNDLPLAVTLPSVEVLKVTEEEQLRDLMLRVMGETLYDEGSDAFRDEQGNRRSLALDEPMRWSVALLQSSTHSFWRAALPITFLVLLVPAAGVLLAGRSPLAPVAIGAGIGAAASLTTYVFAGFLSNAFDSPVDREAMLILHDGAWIGLRDCLAVAVTSVCVLSIVSMLSRPRYVERAWPASTSTPPDVPSV
jgi:hypothetical protein